MEDSTLGAAYIIAAANIDTDIVFPNLPRDVTMVLKQTMLNMRPPPEFNPDEAECIKELKTFVQFGDYAIELLPKVIENIWKFYRIEDPDSRTRIMRAAGVLVGPKGANLIAE
jgi:hypothetical protein